MQHHHLFCIRPYRSDFYLTMRLPLLVKSDEQAVGSIYPADTLQATNRLGKCSRSIRAYPNNAVRYFSVRQSIVNRFVVREQCSCTPFSYKG
jgi:hypothetical protein